MPQKIRSCFTAVALKSKLLTPQDGVQITVQPL